MARHTLKKYYIAELSDGQQFAMCIPPVPPAKIVGKIYERRSDSALNHWRKIVGRAK